MNRINSVPGAKELLDVLKIFETIPQELAVKYLGEKLGYSQPQNAVRYLLFGKYAFEDSDSGAICLHQWQKIERAKACAFAVFLELSEGPVLRCNASNYPFECIFAAKQRLYQVIDFSNEGILKMNFFKHMRKSPAEKDFNLPVIMLINTQEATLNTMDADGKKFLVPDGNYLVAKITYKGGVQSIDILERKG